jgi:hypothetical protein
VRQRKSEANNEAIEQWSGEPVSNEAVRHHDIKELTYNTCPACHGPRVGLALGSSFRHRYVEAFRTSCEKISCITDLY